MQLGTQVTSALACIQQGLRGSIRHGIGDTVVQCTGTVTVQLLAAVAYLKVSRGIVPVRTSCKLPVLCVFL